MRVTPSAAEVRQRVARLFQRLDPACGGASDINETVRLDSGRFVARTYRYGRFMAMWLIDVGLVQCYDHDGNMLATIDVLEEVEQRAAAA